VTGEIRQDIKVFFKDIELKTIEI